MPPVNLNPQENPSWESFRSILPSEFQDALKDNRPPRPGVLQAARALRENPAPSVTASKERIQEIQRQMHALRAEMHRLTNEDNVRLAVVEACSTICAPARRLPVDVLREIFQYTLPDYPSPSTLAAPTTLSHVSSAWRSVALQSPRLWSKIYLRIKTLDNRNVVRYAQAVNTWARRAGRLPVGFYLYVDCKIVRGTDPAYDFRLLLNTIASWSFRISRLGIGGQYWSSVMVQFADIQWDLRNLETLEILGQRAYHMRSLDINMALLHSLARRITLFRTCGPKFTTLIARQEVSNYLSTFSFLPWTSLTSIVLTERLPSERELQDVLILCPRIRVAALTFGDVNTFVTPTEQVVCHLEQLHLSVTAHMVHALPNFFSAFRFPNLTHLEINSVEGVLANNDEPDIIASFPALSFLSLPPLFSSSYIVKFLQNTPQLQVFQLTFDGPSADLNKLLSSMTINNTNTRNFLHLLQDFSVHTRRFGTLVDVPILSTFIDSRTRDRPPNHPGLKRFKMTGHFDVLTELPEEMFCVSDGTSSLMELNTGSSSGRSHFAKGVRLPESFLANERYKTLVAHLGWVL